MLMYVLKNYDGTMLNNSKLYTVKTLIFKENHSFLMDVPKQILIVHLLKSFSTEAFWYDETRTVCDFAKTHEFNAIDVAKNIFVFMIIKWQLKPKRNVTILGK